ncbi:MAG: hypothetical protein WBC51_27415 [Vicinamibacterales bacterium]
MTKQTRYFMAGSAAILVAGLCTGLVAYYGGGFQALSASTGPTELAYVPADASVVAYADVRSIMDSELRQRLKTVFPGEKGQEEFKRETGIDIEKDVDYIVASFSPAGDESVHPVPLVVVRGAFSPDQLEALAREHGGVSEEYRGKRIVKSPNGDQHALAFLEPGLVAIGAVASVKKAIDAQMSAQSITGNDEMMNLVGDIAASNNAWAVGRFDLISKQAKLPEQIARQIPPVKWFAAAGHINGGVSALIRAEANDDQAAENLRDVVRGFLALGRLQSQGDPRIAAIANSMQLEGSGKTVQLSFTVPAEVIELVLPKRQPAAAEMLHEGLRH